jgi:hypothetical protein
MCIPKVLPQPNDPYVYIRAEVAALTSIRDAVLESAKIKPPSPAAIHPEALHDAVEMYTIANTVSDYYDCAANILKDYKNSENEHIRLSAAGLLEAIEMTKAMDARVLNMMESLYKATRAEDIDQPAVAKELGNMKSLQKDVHDLTMMAVKLSTFAIVRLEGEGENVKPVALAITKRERDTLLADVQELTNNTGPETYIDICAEILIKTLNMPLPTAVAP